MKTPEKQTDQRGGFASGVVLGGKCPVCGGPNPKRHGSFKKTCSLSCSQKLRFQTDPKVKKLLLKYRYVCLGWHGKGKGARDNPDHANAKAIRVRDPLGVVHEIKNITSWCRKNEQLFKPYDNPEAKLPLWRRAQVGLTSIACGDKCSWHGWTAVCVFDIEADPLARRVALPPNNVLCNTPANKNS